MRRGEALSTVGDEHAAMERFTKALNSPGSDRVTVRLAIAQLMANRGDADGAKATDSAPPQMESQTGETAPPTGRASFSKHRMSFVACMSTTCRRTIWSAPQAAGAPDASVKIGMANNYLAIGDTARAKGEIARRYRTTTTASRAISI